MQFVANFVFALGFALRGDVLVRFLNASIGVLAALALAGLTRRHLARGAGAMAGTLFFTLPLTWSQMTRVGADLALVLFGALTVSALLDWVKTERPADLRRAGLMAGLAAATKTMGLLVPALVGITVIVVALHRARPLARIGAMALGFGMLVLVAGSPFYLRNAIETGNPLYPLSVRLQRLRRPPLERRSQRVPRRLLPPIPDRVRGAP
jgi:4-amino-4-deoxy-L-arabinose transferase-like glycosyltransferase